MNLNTAAKSARKRKASTSTINAASSSKRSAIDADEKAANVATRPANTPTLSLSELKQLCTLPTCNSTKVRHSIEINE